MAEEMDVIQHLIEVEKEAAEVLVETQKKADETVASARVSAQARFKNEYSKIVKSVDEAEAKEKEAASKEHDNILKSYNNDLNSAVKDVNSFNNGLEKILYGNGQKLG